MTPDKASRGQKTVALMIAGTSNTVLSMVLQMIVTRLFTKEEVAIYNQGQLVFTTVQPILQMGVSSGIYYHFVRNKHRARAVMNEGVLITVLTSAIFGLFVLFHGNVVLAGILGNHKATRLLYFLIPYVLVCVPETIAHIGFIYTNRIRFSSWYSIMKSLLCACTLIVFALVQDSGSVLFAARVAAQSLLGVLTFYLIYRYVVRPDGSHIEKDSMKSLLMVSLPLGIASMLGRLYTNLDSWVVSGFMGPEAYSVFQMGAFEIPFIGIITNSVSTVMTVDITTAIREKKYQAAISLFRGIAYRTSQILMPIMVFFLFAARNFICFMFTESYVGAIPFFLLYLLYIPVHTVMYGPIMVALGKSKIILARDAAAFAMNALLSIILVIRIGAIGATIATIFITYVYSVPLDIYLIAKWCNVKWHQVLPYAHMIRCILLAVPGGVVSYFVDRHFFAQLSYFYRLIGMFGIYAVLTGITFKVAFQISYVQIAKGLLKRKL